MGGHWVKHISDCAGATSLFRHIARYFQPSKVLHVQLEGCSPVVHTNVMDNVIIYFQAIQLDLTPSSVS
jgi:spore cortex formation protein SpoVR/YcgB (stage V sporulation)